MEKPSPFYLEFHTGFSPFTYNPAAILACSLIWTNYDFCFQFLNLVSFPSIYVQTFTFTYTNVCTHINH